MSFTTVKAPLFSPAYRNVDGVALNDKSYALYDCYVDELGFTNKRPGLAPFVELGLTPLYPIMGLFWWPQKDCVIAAVSDFVYGGLYKITYTGGTPAAANLTTDGPGVLPPSFAIANDGNVSTPTIYCVAAAGRSGSTPVESNGTGSTTSSFTGISDVGNDCPTGVTHVGFIDGYLLAVNGTNRLFWSDVNAPTAWTGTSYISASGSPDFIQSMIISNRLIYLFGTTTTEILENDGQTPFSRISGGFIETGIGAPYSVVIDAANVYWLNHERHFVSASGNSVKQISTPYDKEIAGFSSVSDCRGARIEINGQSFLKFDFPTEQRTLVFNVSREEWHEWRYWNSTYGEYEHFLGQCHVYVPTWGKHLVGSRKSAVIYELTPDALDDVGTEIRAVRQSGHIDYGTSGRKRSRGLRIRCRRGDGGSTTPRLIIRWKDDNRAWSNEHEISLGAVGEREIVQRIFPMGVFRTRQYELAMTDGVPLVYGDAEEELEVLE